MNTNLAVLVTELRKHYHVQCDCYYNLQISGIKLMEDPKDIDPSQANVLHIIQLRSLTQLMEAPLQVPILCITPTDNLTGGRTATTGAGPVILVYADRMDQVLVTLSGILYHCGQMTSPLEDMSKELLRCRSLDQALDVGYRWLKNPLIVADRHHAVLESTKVSQFSFLKYDGMWTKDSIFPNRSCITATVEAMERSMISSWPCIVEATDGGPQYLCKTLCNGETVEGYLLLYLIEQEQVENAEAMLELLGNFCTVLLRDRNSNQNGRRRDQDPLGSVLQMMLSDTEVTRSKFLVLILVL